MNRLVEQLLDLLYPPKCAFCRRLAEDGRMLCPDCEKNLPFPEKEMQVQHFPHLALCASPLYYTGDVKKSLQRYKFHGAAAYCRIYGELMADCLTAHAIDADLVTWVPLSGKRLRQRGYDQARLLAEEVARRKNLECCCLLAKQKNNRAQSGVGSPEERARNVRGVYRCTGDASGKRILLVDDIVTTGATLSEAAGVLLAAGAESVTALTLARNEKSETGHRTDRNGDS
jgi:ComF family protein